MGQEEDERLYRVAEDRLWASFACERTERRVRIEPQGIEVRVQETGEGPPVLFIHGASNGGSSWVHLVSRLPGFRCILVDRPGCGLSDPLNPVPSDLAGLERYADGLLGSLLDALELDKAHVVGTSGGGYFSLRGTAAQPDRVDRLVLFSWSLGAPIEKVPMSMRLGAIQPLAKLSAKMPVTRGIARMILRQVGLKNAIDSGLFGEEALDWFVAVLRHTSTMQNELEATPRMILPLRGLNTSVLLSDELLSRVTVPTLTIWGEDDPQGGAATARAFSSRLPNSELDLRPGAGHSPWIDEPDHAAAEVQRFLTA